VIAGAGCRGKAKSAAAAPALFSQDFGAAVWLGDAPA
jgi:hypothetical protein